MSASRRRILVVQGANMNRLGCRDPAVYGTTTAAQLDEMLLRRAADLNVDLEIFYSDLEGEAINRIYARADELDGPLLNPAGFLHTGYALRDCLASMRFPCIEVHMSNIEKRGFHSVTAAAATGMICGLGIRSYLVGPDAVLRDRRSARRLNRIGRTTPRRHPRTTTERREERR